MRLFQKSKFLQKIKESVPGLTKIKSSDCTYRSSRFSEWLEFEYGNYYYVFYHARRWGGEKLRYRKSYFDAFTNRQRAPFEIKEIKLIKEMVYSNEKEVN